MEIKRCLWLIPAIALLASPALALDPALKKALPKVPAPSTGAAPVVPVSAMLCADPSIKVVVTAKQVSNGAAHFELQGTMCNVGPGDYDHPDNPLTMGMGLALRHRDGALIQDPETTKWAALQPVGVLKKGECRNFMAHQSIAKGFLEFVPVQAYAKYQIEVHGNITNKADNLRPNRPGYQKALNCDINNDATSQIFYVK